MMTDQNIALTRRRHRSHSLTSDVSVTRFKEWLTANGAEVLSSTNPYEVVRFRGTKGVSIIYRNDSARPPRMTGESEAAWSAFTSGQAMRFVRSFAVRTKSDPVIRTLLDRDGNACFYCTAVFSDDLPPTREHLLSRTHGGPDHIANQALACAPCNRLAGHMSLVEKIKLRDQIQSGVVS